MLIHFYLVYPCPFFVKLKRVQNATARVIVDVEKYEHISDYLRLHWNYGRVAFSV